MAKKRDDADVSAIEAIGAVSASDDICGDLNLDGLTADELAARGLERLEPITITGTWANERPRPPCPAQPCPICLGCSVCGDFHGYGRGCTDQSCPLRIPHEPDA